MALQPTVTSQGIKYIKVNKQDFNGLDLNVPLSQLDALRIRYSNGTIGQYNLLGEPSEYPDYYLLRVSPNSSFTSSADNTITNYTAVASTGSGAIVTPSSFGETYPLNNLTVSSNPGGYLDGVTGIYDVPSLTNIPIIISSSVNATNTNGSGFAQTLNLNIQSSLRGILSTNGLTIADGASRNVSSSYSGFMIEGEDITFQWGSVGIGGPLSVNSSTFYVTQSNAPATPSENLVILEPYNTTNFYNSDYNAIINNSEVNRLSSDYQLVDYATNQLVPVNFTQLLQGIGTRASIPDSFFTSLNNIFPRYLGTKNTSDDFNIKSTTVTKNIESQQNIFLGNNTLNFPSVDLNRTYFAYFNWAGGTSPEWGTFNEDKTTYNIRFFVDENGNVIKPLNDSNGINLGIMRQNFTEGEVVVSSLNNTDTFGTNLSILNGSYNIFKSGKTIQPILYTQTSSYDLNGNTVAYGFTGSISFNVQLGNTSVPNYGFLAYKSTTQPQSNIALNTTNNIVLTFPTESYDYDTNYNTGTSIYQFGSDTEVKVSFRATVRHDVDFLWEDPFITPGQQLTVQLAIQLSEDGGVTFSDLAVKNVPFTITDTGVKETTFSTLSRLFNSGDRIRVVMKTYNVLPNPFNERANMNFYVNSNFGSAQNQGGFSTPIASGSGVGATAFWSTGSTPSNVLTASVSLTSLYSYRQNDIYNSGFNAISYPFEIQPYDEIRFEGIEGNSYTVISSSLSDRLYLYLDRNISPGGTNLNFFLIRRYVDDPAFIVLDVDKPAGDSGEGILKPEYLTNRVEGQIDTILDNLQERGLIT
jgi:hypothetical protein